MEKRVEKLIGVYTHIGDALVQEGDRVEEGYQSLNYRENSLSLHESQTLASSDRSAVL